MSIPISLAGQFHYAAVRRRMPHEMVASRCLGGIVSVAACYRRIWPMLALSCTFVISIPLSHSVVAFFHGAGAEMNPTSCLVADSLANFTAAQRRPAVLCRCCMVVT